MTIRRSGRALLTELVVVVAGVLIALWADGLAAERSQQRELERRLGAVATEFRETAAQLDRRAEESALEIAALNELHELGPALNNLPFDSTAALVDKALLGVNVFSPGLPALQDLEESGLIPSIESPELRRTLRSIREALRTMATLTEVNQTGPQEGRFDEFVLNDLPFVWEHLAHRDGMSVSAPLVGSDWSPLWSPRGRGLIAMRYDFLDVMTSNWRSFADGFRRASERIDEELAKS